jgi:hypothetical protein
LATGFEAAGIATHDIALLDERHVRAIGAP